MNLCLNRSVHETSFKQVNETLFKLCLNRSVHETLFKQVCT